MQAFRTACRVRELGRISLSSPPPPLPLPWWLPRPTPHLIAIAERKIAAASSALPHRANAWSSAFVLSTLLFAAELWRVPWEQLRRVQRFYDRCLRTIAGVNRRTMWEKHISDATVFVGSITE